MMLSGTEAVDITTCDLGDKLVIDENVITERTIGDSGFYLFNESVSCDGIITILEVCGVLTNIVDANHFFAAIYRPKMTNGTLIYERVTDSEDIDVYPDFISGISLRKMCGYALVNWRVQQGDTIGISFTNFCQFEEVVQGLTTTTRTVNVCPVFAALNTSKSTDSVFFSRDLNTSSLTVTKDELTLKEGLRLNIRANIGEC